MISKYKKKPLIWTIIAVMVVSLAACSSLTNSISSNKNNSKNTTNVQKSADNTKSKSTESAQNGIDTAPVVQTAANTTDNTSTINNSSNSKISDNSITTSSSYTPTVSVQKIFDILSSQNNDVIDSLNLLDSNSIKSLDELRFYVPVFNCKKLGILIGFDGAPFDPIDKIKGKNETPIFIIPNDGTTISFDKNINFRVGDDIQQFKSKFGEGKASKGWGLKGDKKYCLLAYDIGNLSVGFTSLDGDDFKKYQMDIKKLK